MLASFFISDSSLELGELRHKGYHSFVHEGIYSDTNEKVAIFIYDKCQSQDFLSFQHLLRKLEISAALNHPFIAKLIGFTPSIYKEDKGFAVAYKYVPNGTLGDLFKHIKSYGMPNWYDGTAKTKIAYGIAVGMAYIHSKRIFHGDLRPENIMLDENYNPIIIDFGLSKFIDINDKFVDSRTENPSVDVSMFKAPEVIGECGILDLKSDVYSYSLILYMLLTGNQPYDDRIRLFRLLNDIKNGIKPPLAKDEENSLIGNLIKSCWNMTPEIRPSFDEIVRFFRTSEDLVFNGCDTLIFNRYMLQY